MKTNTDINYIMPHCCGAQPETSTAYCGLEPSELSIPLLSILLRFAKTDPQDKQKVARTDCLINISQNNAKLV